MAVAFHRGMGKVSFRRPLVHGQPECRIDDNAADPPRRPGYRSVRRYGATAAPYLEKGSVMRDFMIALTDRVRPAKARGARRDGMIIASERINTVR